MVVEEATLLASLVKWTTLGASVGVVVGGSTAAFLWVLARAIDLAAAVPHPLWLLPAGFLGASVLVRVLAPDAEGHGTEKVIEAVHRRWGRIAAKVAPVKLIATVITIAAGGSVGKEGPCAQIGAALASALATLLGLRPRDRRKLVICGISAGFATVFGTPIAGSIFGIEVLYLGTVLYDVLYPSFVAGIVGFQISSWLGIRYFREQVYGVPKITQGIFLRTVLAGIVFGLVALLLIEVLRRTEALVRRTPGSRPVKALAGGSLLAGLAALVGLRYLGLGVDTLEAAIRGAWVPSLAFAWKIVFTAISLAAGGSGGIVTPIFFVGAVTGSAFGHLLGFDRGTFAAIGMVAVLAGAANTPLSASIMAIEMFGTEIGPFAAIACIVSFVMVGHRSVYPSQVLSMAKTPSVRIRQGVEIARHGQVVLRPSGVMRALARVRAWYRARRRQRADG
jgi:H+/Cl- antiporter ClcA